MTQAPVEPASQASAPVSLGAMPLGSPGPFTPRSRPSQPEAPTQVVSSTPTRRKTAAGLAGEPNVAPVTVHDYTWSSKAVTLSVGGRVRAPLPWQQFQARWDPVVGHPVRVCVLVLT